MRAIIIGAGRMGQRFIDICGRCDVEVVGLTDINKDALISTKNLYSLADDVVFQKFDSVFESANAQLAIIATTAPSHFDYARRAIENGIGYVLCEKPVVTNLNDYERLLDLVKNEGTYFAVNHQMRHIEEYKYIKRRLIHSDLGELISMSVIGGNAGISMNGTHFLELFNFLTGEKLDRVSGWFDKEVQVNTRGKQYCDPGGFIKGYTTTKKYLTIDFHTNAGYGLLLVINTTHSQIVADLLSGEMIINSRKPEDRHRTTGLYGLEPTVERYPFNPLDVTKSSTIVLKELLKGPKGNFCTLKDAGELIKTVLASYHSDNLDHVAVKIDSNFGEPSIHYQWA